MNAFEAFDKIVKRFEDDAEKGIHHELAVKLTGSTHVMWDCELRYTPVVNAKERGDYSFTIYICGGENPERVLARALTELKQWADANFTRDMPGTSAFKDWPTYIIGRKLDRGDEWATDQVEDEDYPFPESTYIGEERID